MATPESQSRRIQLGTGLLIAAGIIARSEIGVLCAVILAVDLILSPSPKKYLFTVLPSGLVSGIVATAATVTVDTELWSSPSFPELEALLFNVVDGHASDWGVEPWYFYLLSLPKLLLNPLAPMLLASSVVITFYTSTSVVDTLRKLRYILVVPALYVAALSLLDHKEWRFVIYVVPLLTTATSISAAYIFLHRKDSRAYRFLNSLLILSIPLTLGISLVMGTISSTNYPGAQALTTLHGTCNASHATVFLDVPTRMTGATLPLCSRGNWTYVKTENATLLDSPAFWQDIDYAIVGSLAGNPCKRGKGIEGKGEWEILFCQKGYEGIGWRTVEEARAEIWNSSYVRTVVEDERVRNVVGRAGEVLGLGRGYVRNVTENEHVRSVVDYWGRLQTTARTFAESKSRQIRSHSHVNNIVAQIHAAKTNILSRVENNKHLQTIISHPQYLRAKAKLDEIWHRQQIKVPWIKLDHKVFVLKHMRKEDLDERQRVLEEKRAKEREGLGKAGEIEGQWRDFY
jgi:Alg9-like mannosyltransferase family